MLVDFLERNGPCLTTDLTEYLVKQGGLSEVAARKQVSRGHPKIKRLAHLVFPRRSRFLYLEEQFSDYPYWDRLFEAIERTNSCYARALKALEARGGAVRRYEFTAVCGSPKAQIGHVAADAVLERLMKANVLVEKTLPGLGACVMTKLTYDMYQGQLEKLAIPIQSRLLAESILLDTLKEWLRNLAIVSYDSVELRAPKMPRVGTFEWDLSGPSYLTSVVDWTKDKEKKPGLVTCDVLLKRVTLSNIEPYLAKVRTMQALKKLGRTMFIFVAQSYEHEAFKALRSAGVVPATTTSLFGQEAADGFGQLIATLSQAALGIVRPEDFDELFARLGKVEGAVGNMRGAFFELLVAEVVRKRSSGLVSVNQVCQGEDGNSEVDVYNYRPDIVAQMIECKGIAPGSLVDDKEIDLWLFTRIKRVRHHLRVIGWSSPLPIFELWTSGTLSPAARDRVEKTKLANAKKFDLRIVDGDRLRDRVVDVNDKSLLRTFEQHFLPLAKA